MNPLLGEKHRDRVLKELALYGKEGRQPVNILQQVPRNALVWIIICQFALVAPHAGRLPVWVLAVYVVAVVWRLQVHRGRWSFPGRWVKVALTVSSFIGIYASYGSLIGLEPTVALLLTAFALKLIELSQRKDAYVLLFLGYFICITEFLFSQDLLITLYSLLNVTLVTTALVALHQPGEHQFNRGTMRLASIMLLQAMPLMIVLFFLFPRFAPAVDGADQEPHRQNRHERLHEAWRCRQSQPVGRCRLSGEIRRRDSRQVDAVLARPGVQSP